MHGPVEVSLPIALAKWQPFAQGRLVDLDELDTGSFEIEDLLSDRQSDL
jgi:hypothetical protein